MNGDAHSLNGANVIADGDVFQPRMLVDFCLRALVRNYDALGRVAVLANVLLVEGHAS